MSTERPVRRTRWTHLLSCVLGAGVITWVIQQAMLRHHGWVPALTAWGAAVAVVLSAGVLVAGLAVRRLKAGKPTWISLTGAAVTAAAAQASALVGSVMAGAYGGELVVALANMRRGDAPAFTSLAWSATACALAGVLWCGVGLLVEHWCSIDLSDDDQDRPGAGASNRQPGGATARTREH